MLVLVKVGETVGADFINIETIHRGNMTDSTKNAESQADKFRKAARELETDQSEEAFDRVLRKVTKATPQKAEEKVKKGQ